MLHLIRKHHLFSFIYTSNDKKSCRPPYGLNLYFHKKVVDNEEKICKTIYRQCT